MTALDEGKRDASGETSFSLSGFWAPALGISFLGLLLRLINVLLTIDVPTIEHLVGDARGYYDWAIEISSGEWIGKITFYQAPLYPYFLAVLMKLFGFEVMGIRVTQAMLGALGALGIGVSTCHWFGRRAGILAVAMLACYPAAIFYDGILQKASLAAVLMCLLLAGIASWQRQPRTLTAVICGVLLGLLIITRENALLWLPILPIWVVAYSRTRPWKWRGVQAASFLAGSALILFPVAARNAYLGGEWSPSTFQAGPNFYIGNSLTADGVYSPLVSGHETPMFERADAQRLAESATGRELTARQVSSFWMSKSIDEIQQDPSRWLGLMTRKTLMVLNHFEVPDVESLQFFKLSSPLLHLETVWHFGVLLPLAVFGIAISLGKWRQLSLLYLLVASMIAAIALFFILGRYRFPLVPLLIPFAATGVVRLIDAVKLGKWTEMTGAMAIAGAFALISNLNVHDQTAMNAAAFMNQGVSACQHGELDHGITLLQESIRIKPDYPEAQYNLGKAWMQADRLGRAIRCFQIANRLAPTLIQVDSHLGECFERIGQIETAMQHYRRAVQLDPTDDFSRRALQRLSR